MIIDSGGTKATIKAQMEARIKECYTKMAAIRELLARPTMQEVGYLAGLRTLFESVITATALYSSGTWIGMTKTQAEWYNKEMKNLWSVGNVI